jgi:hypothetical protein
MHNLLLVLYNNQSYKTKVHIRYKTFKLLNSVIEIILVCIIVLEVMFSHNEYLMEAKDICSRASGNLRIYLI